MDDPGTVAADWVLNLVRDFQDKITCGLYEAVYNLDGEPLDNLMQGQAHACGAAFVRLFDLPDDMDLDAFLSKIRSVGPSQIDLQRDGDVIHWTELHQGQCVCPFIKRGVVRLDPKLCICGAHWVKYLFESIAKTPVEVEIVETVATGAQNCRFKITLKTEPA